MEGAFAQQNASGTQDWTRVGSALPWIHVITALVRCERSSCWPHPTCCSPSAGCSGARCSCATPAPSPGTACTPRDRSKPRVVQLDACNTHTKTRLSQMFLYLPHELSHCCPPDVRVRACVRVSGCVYCVLLLHTQLRVERVRSAASQPMVRPSPAFCAARDAKWQDDRTAFWRGSASPDGARLHRRKRRRLRRRLQRRLQMSVDANRRASCRRRATDRGLPPVARLRRRRLPRRLLAHARRHVGAHGKVSSDLPARGDGSRLPWQPAAGVPPGAGLADAGALACLRRLLGTNGVPGGRARDDVIDGRRRRVRGRLVRRAGRHVGVAGRPPLRRAGVRARPTGTDSGAARRRRADAAAASAEDEREELPNLRTARRPSADTREIRLRCAAVTASDRGVKTLSYLIIFHFIQHTKTIYQCS
ncbi:transmembrane protein 116 isoform X3 [Phyllopteryx taeniolatus]|uniref:transmembrane protein 116 isoform X3 n=1 Tax=Phyllopteryx taeniolatus TaxID=161469 RepID=UPI002AD3CFE6|nr:transmembrane protein 116 isoform X3 [Phyllopteryx taeniolatus]